MGAHATSAAPPWRPVPIFLLLATLAWTGAALSPLGPRERAALELGFSPAQTAALQALAHDELAAEGAR